MSDTKTAETDVITCDACPVLCRIREGKSGACSRYANFEGKLTRTDPLVVTQQISNENGDLVPFLPDQTDWDGSLNFQSPTCVTGTGMQYLMVTALGEVVSFSVGLGSCWLQYARWWQK